MGVADAIQRLLGLEIIADKRSAYSNIVVVQKKNERVLISDKVIYSKLRNDSLYTDFYWDYFIPLPALFRDPKILIVGLGGGTIPYQYNKLYKGRADIDVVEIDREMVRMANVFLTEKPEMKIIIGDGPSYIATVKDAYDIIIFDAYRKGTIPQTFLEESLICDTYSALKRDGILAINYAFSLNTLLRKRRYTRMLRHRFNLYSIKYAPLSGNVIFICSKRFSKEEMLRKIEEKFVVNSENRRVLNSYSRMG